MAWDKHRAPVKLFSGQSIGPAFPLLARQLFILGTLPTTAPHRGGYSSTRTQSLKRFTQDSTQTTDHLAVQLADPRFTDFHHRTNLAQIELLLIVQTE